MKTRHNDHFHIIFLLIIKYLYFIGEISKSESLKNLKTVVFPIKWQCHLYSRQLDISFFFHTLPYAWASIISVPEECNKYVYRQGTKLIKGCPFLCLGPCFKMSYFPWTPCINWMVSASATDRNSPAHDYLQYNLPWSDEQSLSTDMEKTNIFYDKKDTTS